MQHTSQAHQPVTSQPAAQREAKPGCGTLSVQLAQSPRQAAQRRQLDDLRAGPVQRAEGLEDEDEAGAAQLRALDPVQRQDNRTGMPDGLKAGIESLSGMDMSDVRVHRNSSQPAQLNALAYAQGNDIHLGPGQEQQLPHEAWHVVQQRQGRVQATMQMAGVGVNDDVGLEREADAMGGRAVQMISDKTQELTPNQRASANSMQSLGMAWGGIVQQVRDELKAWEIGFTQASIGSSFSSVPKGVEPRLAKLGSSAAEVDKGTALPGWLTGLRVFSIRHPVSGDERILSLDNRRLKVIKLSTLGNQVDLPVQWVDINTVIAECFKFTNTSIWDEAVVTDQPSQKQRTIAPTGNLLGDFFAALLGVGAITAQGQPTGAGAGAVGQNWSFNQAP